MGNGSTSPTLVRTTTGARLIHRSSLRRWEWISVVGILFLAAVLRLGAPGVVEFKRDEATLSRLALDLAKGEHFPWLGIGSSVGFPNSPINVYIFAIPFLVSDNPLIATLFVGFLNILAVALLWKLTRRYFGPWAALVAGLVYAVSPWAAIYSRKIWAQDILPPFVIVTVFLALLGYMEGKRWAQLLHLPLLAITVQIHFGAVVLVPLSTLIILWYRSNWRREMWIGIGIAILTGLPYLYGLYDADQLSLVALRDSLESGSVEEQSISQELSTVALDYAWFTIAGTDIHSLAGAEQFQRYLDSVPPAYAFFKLLPIGVVLSMIALLYRHRSRLILILAAWLVLPVVAFTYTWAAPQPHYMIPLMPVAFMVLGGGIAFFLEQWRPAVYAVVGTLIALVVLQMWLFLTLLDFLNTHNTTGAFGTPLHYLLRVRETVLQDDPTRVVVVSEGNSPQFDNDPAVWDVLLDRVPQVTFIEGRDRWLLPADEAVLLVGPTIEHTWQKYVEGSPSGTFDLRSGEGQYHLWRDFALDMPPLEPVEAQYANGVHLVGIANEDGVLWLEWLLPKPSANVLYIVFVHAMNGEERIGQVDVPFVAETYWVDGDRVYMQLALVTETATSLRIGMYQIVGERNFRNSELVDKQGRYLDQWFTAHPVSAPTDQ